MEENLYKKLKSVGASNLVFGILIILFGIGAGIGRPALKRTV